VTERTPARPVLEPKAFYRRMEALLERTPGRVSARAYADRLLAGLCADFGETLGLDAA
jgi:hypothetical protein